jgi:hypothetical protein
LICDLLEAADLPGDLGRGLEREQGPSAGKEDHPGLGKPREQQLFQDGGRLDLIVLAGEDNGGHGDGLVDSEISAAMPWSGQAVRAPGALLRLSCSTCSRSSSPSGAWLSTSSRENLTDSVVS